MPSLKFGQPSTSLAVLYVFTADTLLYSVSFIGGFRDTYLVRQVVPEGREQGRGQLGVWGSAVSSPSGVSPSQPKSNLVPFYP